MILVLLPFPGLRQAPPAARILLGLALGWHLGPLLRPEAAGAPLGPGLMTEAAMAVLLALAASLLLGVVELACQMIGLQAGLSYASTIDPNSEADSNVLQVLAFLVGGLLFFALGLDHALFRALGASLQALPPGAALPGAPAAAAKMLGASFTAAVSLAAPVVVVLVLTDISLSVFSRLQPQLPLITLALPLKVGLGVLILAATSALWPGAISAAARWAFGPFGWGPH